MHEPADQQVQSAGQSQVVPLGPLVDERLPGRLYGVVPADALLSVHHQFGGAALPVGGAVLGHLRAHFPDHRLQAPLVGRADRLRFGSHFRSAHGELMAVRFALIRRVSDECSLLVQDHVQGLQVPGGAGQFAGAAEWQRSVEL